MVLSGGAKAFLCGHNEGKGPTLYELHKGFKASRFLSYIPKNLLDLSAFVKKKTTYMPELKSLHRFKVGDRVWHEVFGEGWVLSLIHI